MSEDQMARFIRIMHEYEGQELLNFFSALRGEKWPIRKTTDSSTLWFLGLKIWGKDFPRMEYEIREEGRNERRP